MPTVVDTNTDQTLPASPAIEMSLDSLCGLWREVLGVETIGPDDNFFDVGGCSLTATQLSLELESRYQLRLDIAAIFQHPTVREQCRVLGRRVETVTAGLQHFVPLQTAGDLPPLFCIAHAPYLGGSRPVYSFPGLYDRIHATSERWSRADLARVVEECLADVNAVAPRGPIHLNGYCHGAWLVLALAQRLSQSGRQVAYVGLVEAHPRPEWTWSGWLRNITQTGRPANGSTRTPFAVGRAVARGVYRSTSTFAHRAALRLMGAEGGLRRTYVKLCDAVSHSDVPAEDRLRHFQNVDVYRAFEKAAFSGGIDGPIDLYLRTDDLTEDEIQRRVREWNAASRQGVRVHRIQGDHITIRQTENLQVLADRVSHRLREVEAEL